MLRTGSIRILAVVMILLTPPFAAAQSAEDVVEKALTALGGRAALAKIKSRLATGAVTLGTPVGDIDGTVEIQNVAPNKVRTLIKATVPLAGQLVIDQRFDGTSGYVLDSLRGNRDITGNQLDNLRNGSFPHPLLGYKEAGTTARLAGKEKVGARDAYVIIVTPAKGSEIRHYIDVETSLPMKTVMKIQAPLTGQEVEQTQEFSDYREVEGVKVAFVVKSTSPVQTFTMRLSKVEQNARIDESMFAKPPTQ